MVLGAPLAGRKTFESRCLRPRPWSKTGPNLTMRHSPRELRRHLSFTRKVVARVGIEPTTRGFSGEGARNTAEPIDDESTTQEVDVKRVVDAACAWVTVVWKPNGNSRTPPIPPGRSPSIARVVRLYADAAVVPDHFMPAFAFTDKSSREDTTWLLVQLTVLHELTPLFRDGILSFAAPVVGICDSCDSEMRRRIETACEALLTETENSIRVTRVGNEPGIVPTALDPSVSRGFVALAASYARSMATDGTDCNGGFQNCARICITDLGGELSCAYWKAGTAPPQLKQIPDPKGVAVISWTQVDVGPNHVCVVTQQRDVWCFGDNSWGQFGTGAWSNMRTEEPVTAANR